MLFCHQYIFFGEVSVTVLCPFLIGFFVSLLLNFQSSLCIWDNSSLSDVSFPNIFSQSVAVFSFSSCFHITEVFNFNATSYFFHDCVLGVESQKSLPHPRSPRFSPMLRSRSFIVFYTFRSVIHFDLIVVNHLRSLF